MCIIRICINVFQSHRQVALPRGNWTDENDRINDQRTISNSPLARNTPSPSLTEGFSELNEAIALFCRRAAREALKSCPFDGIPSTDDVKHKDGLRKVFPQDNHSSMMRSELEAPRPLLHAINYGLCSIISKVLHDEIFDAFHPSLSGSVGAQHSHYLNELYDKTRLEGQIVRLFSPFGRSDRLW